MIHLRRVHREAVGLDEFLALGLIALSYGIALLLHAYGFLAVFAADVAFPGTSNANWFQDGQILAVTTVSAVDAAGAVTVFAGGPGRSQFLIDIIGFYT